MNKIEIKSIIKNLLDMEDIIMSEIINFEDLNNVAINDKGEIIVLKDNVKFYFSLNMIKNDDSCIIFSNGAIDRQAKQPPIYQRVSWKSDIKASTIYVDDPTIHEGDLSLGWGIGRENHYYLESISEILKVILKRFDIKDGKTTYFGSSAGGTMSMILASMHKESYAIVNNPQTRVEHFYSGNHLRKIIKAYFPNFTESEFIKVFKDRISVVEAFKKNDHCPNVIYILNRQSYFDMNIDYKFFVEGMEKNNLSMNSVNFLIYNDEIKGHNPISKTNTINIINNYSHLKNLWIM